MPQILVNVYATYISVPAQKDGIVANGVGDIRPVLDNLREMDFNPRQKRWFLKNRYYAYNFDTQEFLLPVNCLSDLANTLKHQSVDVKLIRHEPVETKTIDINMNPSWKDRDEHGEPIAHLTHTVNPMRACDLQTGKGKSLPLNTPIRIPGGWKLMRDIRVGDMVVSMDGTQTTVTGVYPQGLLPAYRITFEDGRFQDCSRDHLWRIYVNYRSYVVSTGMIHDLIREGNEIYIDLIEPENFVQVEDNLKEMVQSCMDARDIPDEYLEGSLVLRQILFDEFLKYVHLGPDKKDLLDKLIYIGRSIGYICWGVYNPERLSYSIRLRHSPARKLKVFGIEHTGSDSMQCISVDHFSRLYVVKDFIVTHNTYCAIRAITNLANPTLIVCDGLMDQWKKEFLEKTDIAEDKIYLIKGAPSLVKLFKQKEAPEIFISSIDTLRPYIAGVNAPYTTIPSYPEFLKLYGIGIKVVDEFHLNFSTLVAVDLRSNVKHNLYLSATPKRSSKQEKKIFDLVFPKEIISGGGEYDKYVNITFYRYRLEFTNQNAFKTIHGYSHAKYEAYIMNNGLVRQRFVFSVLLPIINSHYIHTRKLGQKLLVFCRTVMFCDSMKEYIAGHFPDLDVRTYTQSDPDSNLEEADVIVSTAQSCGTGRDIANLITVIQTCSMGSEPLIEQVLGRLRKPKNGDTPEFVDIYNTALPFHMGHYRKRSQIYRSRALKYNEHELV